MDTGSYKDIFDFEENHWWFLGRREIISYFLRHYVSRGRLALDVGCGTGLNAKLLEPYAERVDGIELSEEAVRIARSKNPNLNIEVGDLYSLLEIKCEAYSIVTLFDVLEHLKDDTRVLSIIGRKLEPGGRVLLTVPAFPFLWSMHDVHLHHFRRYKKKTLQEVLERTGFVIQKLSYINFFLFPGVVLIRLFKKNLYKDDYISDFKLPNKVLNTMLQKLFGLERFLLRVMNLPFGVSLICIASKKKAE